MGRCVCVCERLMYMHIYTYSNFKTNMDGSSSAPACLPVWRADVALCLLLRSMAGCRCIMP